MDNKNKQDYRDRTEVNQNEDYEVQYWTKKWNVSKEQLADAIKNSGSTSVKKLEEYFAKK